MAINLKAVKSDRFILREFEDSDLANVYSGLSNPAVISYYGVSYASLSDTVAQMTWFKQQQENDLGIWAAICSPNHSEFYEAVGLNDLEAVHQKAEIGFWLLPAYWGKGIMAEAASLICDFGFAELELNRIEAFVETENQSSKKLLTKLDFLHEGTMMNCEVKNSKFINLDIYAKLKNGNS